MLFWNIIIRRKRYYIIQSTTAFFYGFMSPYLRVSRRIFYSSHFAPFHSSFSATSKNLFQIKFICLTFILYFPQFNFINSYLTICSAIHIESQLRKSVHHYFYIKIIIIYYQNLRVITQLFSILSYIIQLSFVNINIIILFWQNNFRT